MIYRNCFGMKEYRPISPKTLEYGCYKITIANQCFTVNNIYRPCNVTNDSSANHEFSELISATIDNRCPCIYAGDFNIHVNKSLGNFANKFKNLLNAHGLHQTVSDPTHISGNALDLVITPDNMNVVCDVTSGVSDHDIVTFTLPFSTSVVNSDTTIRFRRWAHEDIATFQRDLELCNFTSSSLDHSVESGYILLSCQTHIK